jgi:hypothetical protein
MHLNGAGVGAHNPNERNTRAKKIVQPGFDHRIFIVGRYNFDDKVGGNARVSAGRSASRESLSPRE